MPLRIQHVGHKDKSNGKCPECGALLHVMAPNDPELSRLRDLCTAKLIPEEAKRLSILRAIREASETGSQGVRTAMLKEIMKAFDAYNQRGQQVPTAQEFPPLVVVLGDMTDDGANIDHTGLEGIPEEYRGMMEGKDGEGLEPMI